MCNKKEDCKEGLKCGKRNCRKSGFLKDCCYDPKKSGPKPGEKHYCTPKSKCGEFEGKIMNHTRAWVVDRMGNPILDGLTLPPPQAKYDQPTIRGFPKIFVNKNPKIPLEKLTPLPKFRLM